ncbi:hypothetical protein ALON55S_08449 [Alishewanella longhuensis]
MTAATTTCGALTIKGTMPAAYQQMLTVLFRGTCHV